MTNERNVSVIQRSNNALQKERTYGAKELQLIRRTIAKDATTEEFEIFIEVCKRQGLDPFKRQHYLIVYNKDNADKRQVAYITGIDGYRSIAKRSGNYRPDNAEPDIEYDESAICPETNPKGIIKAIVKVFQYAIDGWYPILGIARWSEFVPVLEEKEWIEVKDKDGKPVLQTEGKWSGRPKRELRPTGKKYLNNQNWLKMPHIMLAKCAEAQALRKGWPEEMGGLYIEEEMQRLQADITSSEIIENYEKEKRMIAINAVDHVPMILAQSEGLVMIETGKVFDTVCELIRHFDDADQIDFWRDQNRIGLQQYWGRSPADALELKKKIEERQEELRSIGGQ